MAREYNMTKGPITAGLWRFALPLMIGNVMQQFYNLTDTWVVGRFIGSDALGAVGASYALLTFLSSVIIGLCLGSSAYLAMAFGRGDKGAVRNGIFMAAVITGAVTLTIIAIFYMGLPRIITLMQVSGSNAHLMEMYLFTVFFGFFFLYIYNLVTNILRGIGNSVVPLVFLGVSVGANVVLDVMFVAVLAWGIRGAALATVLAQIAAGVGILMYFLVKYPQYRLTREDMRWRKVPFSKIMKLSGYTCLQQSVMNFGILVVQSIVNSFGPVVMAAFAVAVKIDTLAYSPVQDFGNAFSVFTAQNFGAGQGQRIRQGIRSAVVSVTIFSLAVSALVCALAPWLMSLFVKENAAAILPVGVEYLRIEGACYLGIGILFLLYGYYRAIDKPMMSVVLTVISLGTRIGLALVLSRIEAIGVTGIWVAIPIGWFLADAAGIFLGRRMRPMQEGELR
ncbi:MAG: MATE family efflux transporter [Lachnospiraceae bacterium]|nr:MATE family efflux transporter [Lachnospiraceae bacterium]